MTNATIIKEVMSSAAEAEIGALFINAKLAVPMRHTLEEMGHPQLATPIVTDNSTAVGIANDTIKQKLTMRDFMDTLRGSGVQTGGPPPLNQSDRQAFANQLDKLLQQQVKA